MRGQTSPGGCKSNLLATPKTGKALTKGMSAWVRDNGRQLSFKADATGFGE
jgi:hypothetical protein